MILGFYISLFCIALYLRYYISSGKGMKEKQDADSRTYLEKTGDQNRDLEIGVALKNPTYLRIRQGGFLLRFLSSMHLADEFKTGNPDLDDLLFISDHPDDFHDLMRDEETRKAVERLFTIPEAFRLVCFGKKLWLQMKPAPTKAQYNNTLRRKILEDLYLIAATIDQSSEMRRNSGKSYSPAKKLVCFVTLHMALLAGGLVSAFVFLQEDTYFLLRSEYRAFLTTSFFVFLFAAVFWVMALRFTLKRTMWYVLGLADFIVVGLAGLFFSAPMLLHEANHMLPQGEPAYYSAPLINKTCQLRCERSTGSGENRRTQTRIHTLDPVICESGNLRVEHSRELREHDYICRSSAVLEFTLRFPYPPEIPGEFDAPVTVKAFDRSGRDDTFAIPIFPGALGWKWIDTRRIRVKVKE